MARQNANGEKNMDGVEKAAILLIALGPELNSLLNTGQLSAKNILSSLSKMVLMKRTGKAGRSLQQDLATRFSSSVMTFS